MDKHTPGPWQMGESHETAVEVQIAREPFSRIATVIGGSRVLRGPSLSGDTMEANARLIAAAPDMLEALRKVDDLLVENATEPTDLQAILRAAIAKAKGR